jgi:transcriptional regulator GlxA family with amidase domain
MDKRIKYVIALMNEDLHPGRSFADLARSVNMSVSRLHHLFKAATGTSPARYRRLLRNEKARVLLQTSFLSVKQVRANLGIDDRSHFEREFKKLYGLTPAQYRAVTLRVAARPAPNVQAAEIAA